MTKYTATIQHHSIARAREVDVGDDLETAKRRADEEFGGGFLDHYIVIWDTTRMLLTPVAERRIGANDWTDCDPAI